jgi:hypothetical protein
MRGVFMLEVIATALRIDRTVQVTVHGILLNNRWGASVRGTYPGNIAHTTDPGRAEVYIEEYENPGSLIAPRSLMPWGATVNIAGPQYTSVSIFINNREAKRVPVSPMPLPSEFEVYALTGSDHLGSIIVPVGHTMGGFFHRVFGPASHEECTRWVNEHGKIDFY